jgi:hypothetical protein
MRLRKMSMRFRTNSTRLKNKESPAEALSHYQLAVARLALNMPIKAQRSPLATSSSLRRETGEVSYGR